MPPSQIAPARTVTQDRSAAVLVWSGLLGFALGALFADWQVVTETGQVLAGLVTYPPDNPFFIYHWKLWSLLNQASGVALRMGASEILWSILVSGLMGLLSFQALALVVYVLSRDALAAIGTAFVIFLSRSAELGVVYPISLLGTQHTYGVVGLSWIVLTAALFGAGRARAGSLLLGLAPAVHPSLGVWLAVLLGIAGAWHPRETWALVRSGRWYFAAGAAATAISLAAQLALMPAFPRIAPDEAQRYLDMFVGFWDAHRGPVNFARAGVWLNVAALGGALVWLMRFGRHVTPAARLFLRFVAVCGAASLLLALVSHLPPSYVPAALLVLMPSRLLNIDVMIAAAILFGTAARRRDLVGQLVLAAGSLTLMLSGRSAVWQFFEEGGSRTLAKLGPHGFLLFLVGGTAVVIGLVFKYERRTGVAAGRTPVRWLRSSVVGLFAAAAALSFVSGIDRDRAERDTILHDRTNDRLFGFAAREPGLLLTGGDLHLVQLRSRRPVLLDGGGLDALPYALEAAPAMEHILDDVYGIDLFNPPSEARGLGTVPLQANRAAWEKYTLKRWQEIARTYGVTQVITPGEWQLQLPIVTGRPGMVLYGIPK